MHAAQSAAELAVPNSSAEECFDFSADQDVVCADFDAFGEVFGCPSAFAHVLLCFGALEILHNV